MLAQATLFDYAALDTETRIVVQQRTTEIKALMKRAASDIIEIGQKLIEVKARLEKTVGYGHFGKWLELEFDWSDDTAGRFMNVARRFGDFPQIAESVAPSALYLLSAHGTPDSARDEAIGRAGNGETITHQAAREIVADHRQQRPALPSTREWTPDPQEVFIDGPAERYAAMLEEPTIPPVPRVNPGMFTSATPEWYTPQHIIDRVISLFGQIDLDPCSNSKDRDIANVPAVAYWTQADDGLSQTWKTDPQGYTRVYMNPPYGDEIPAWVDRLVQAYEGEEIGEAIALLPARVDTNWFRPLWNYALCFVYGRLRFSGAENSAPFPSVVVYMGPDVSLFREVFEEIGRCGVLA